MAETSDIAISMLMVGASLSMLLMGLLISYYGSSKTRNVGLIFLIVGAALIYYVTTMAYDTVGIHEFYPCIRRWNDRRNRRNCYFLNCNN